MKTSYRKLFLAFVFSAVSCILISCAATRQPLYQSTSFAESKIDNIVVLPVLDFRVDSTKKLGGLDNWMHKIIKKRLRRNGYACSLCRDRALIADLLEADLLQPDSSRMRNLVAIQGVRWIFIPYLLDSSSKLTFGSTGNAEVGAVLYDLDKACILWRDKALGQVGQGGLIGMAFKGFMERDAIETATKELMVSFP